MELHQVLQITRGRARWQGSVLVPGTAGRRGHSARRARCAVSHKIGAYAEILAGSAAGHRKTEHCLPVQICKTPSEGLQERLTCEGPTSEKILLHEAA